MKTILASAILAISILSGCREEKDDYITTPAGHKIFDFEDTPIITEGHYSRGEIMDALDARVAEWVEERADQYGVDHLNWLSHEMGYRLHDHWAFETGYGFAHGSSDFSEKKVGAALWNQAWGPELPPEAPGWTVIYNPATGNYNWGEAPLLPVIPHELNHLLGYIHD